MTTETPTGAAPRHNRRGLIIPGMLILTLLFAWMLAGRLGIRSE